MGDKDQVQGIEEDVPKCCWNCGCLTHAKGLPTVAMCGDSSRLTGPDMDKEPEGICKGWKPITKDRGVHPCGTCVMRKYLRPNMTCPGFHACLHIRKGMKDIKIIQEKGRTVSRSEFIDLEEKIESAPFRLRPHQAHTNLASGWERYASLLRKSHHEGCAVAKWVDSDESYWSLEPDCDCPAGTKMLREHPNYGLDPEVCAEIDKEEMEAQQRTFQEKMNDLLELFPKGEDGPKEAAIRLLNEQRKETEQAEHVAKTLMNAHEQIVTDLVEEKERLRAELRLLHSAAEGVAADRGSLKLKLEDQVSFAGGLQAGADMLREQLKAEKDTAGRLAEEVRERRLDVEAVRRVIHLHGTTDSGIEKILAALNESDGLRETVQKIMRHFESERDTAERAVMTSGMVGDCGRLAKYHEGRQYAYGRAAAHVSRVLGIEREEKTDEPD